eukprot:SAG25_NODE_342_length_9432_cov_2.769305_9_plen_24_part_01
MGGGEHNWHNGLFWRAVHWGEHNR